MSTLLKVSSYKGGDFMKLGIFRTRGTVYNRKESIREGLTMVVDKRVSNTRQLLAKAEYFENSLDIVAFCNWIPSTTEFKQRRFLSPG